MDVETALLFVLAAVAVVVVVRLIELRTGLPAAALLTVTGIGYAMLPGPNVVLDPQVILTFVLPPLLYSAALNSSLLAIRGHLRTVVSLSVVLVLVTAVVIGLGFEWFVGGATLAVGIAVGAAVAPPDPVAALAVARKVGLPVRLVTIIQGEGLLNDATALTTLSVAVAAATGGGFSAPSAFGQFLLAAAGGIVVGALVAYGVRLLRHWARDPLVANAISLATPFVAYLLAEKMHVSGVLAVVVAGLIVGHDAPRWASGESRLQTSAVWRLAPLARALDLRADENDQARLRNEARSASVDAALVRLADMVQDRDVDPQVVETMRDQLRSRLTRYQGRLDLLRSSDSVTMPVSPQYEAAVRVRRAAIDAQREELLRWRDAGRLPDAGLRVLERELDLEERLLPDRPGR